MCPLWRHCLRQAIPEGPGGRGAVGNMLCLLIPHHHCTVPGGWTVGATDLSDAWIFILAPPLINHVTSARFIHISDLVSPSVNRPCLVRTSWDFGEDT